MFKLGPRRPSFANLFEFQIVKNNSIEGRQLGSCIVTDITWADPFGNRAFILLLFRIFMFLWKRTFYQHFRFDCLGITAFDRYWKTIWICIRFSFKIFSQRQLNSFHLPLRVYYLVSWGCLFLCSSLTRGLRWLYLATAILWRKVRWVHCMLCTFYRVYSSFVF